MAQTPTDINELDKQIEMLKECKPLPENDVRLLCEKVLKSAGKRSTIQRI